MIITRLVLTLVLVASTIMVSVARGSAASSFKQQWAELVAAAEKEGQLDGFFSHLLSRSKNARKFEKAFESRFKIDLKMNITGSSTQNWERVKAERGAGKNTIDIWTGGSNIALTLLRPAKAITPLKPLLINPEILDAKGWYLGKFPWVDEEKRWTAAFIATPGGSDAGINTGMVDPGKLNSYSDFFDPQWKGKIVMRNLGGGGGSSSLLFIWKVLGKDYMRKLVKASFIATSTRQSVDLLASGNFSICPWCSRSEVRKAKRQGLPVTNLDKGFKEGERLGIGGHTVQVLNRAPHPNAAKLFVNWLLSKEGMYVVQKVTKADSLREDIPKDNVDPEDRRKKGRNYFFLESLPDVAESINEATAFWQKAMRSR